MERIVIHIEETFLTKKNPKNNKYYLPYHLSYPHPDHLMLPTDSDPKIKSKQFYINKQNRKINK